MNCETFFNALHEYVEGSLSPARKRAADGHLEECSDCQLLLQQEETAALALSQGLRHSVQHLSLPSDFLERIENSLQTDVAEKTVPLRESPAPGWLRLVWPAAIAAGILVISFQSVRIFPGVPESASKRIQTAAAPLAGVSIQYSFRLPAWKFRQEGNFTIDTLSYETVFASGTIPTGSRELVPPQQERKTPL